MTWSPHCGHTISSTSPESGRGRGPDKAAVAVAHSLTDVIWHLLTTGEIFQDLGADYYQQRRDPERETQRLVKKLEGLGHSVTLTSAA